MILTIFSQDHVLLIESPLKIYARLGKRRRVSIRLPSYIKCHRALSRVYSWVQAGLYRSARPTNFHLISFRSRRSFAGSSSVHEKSIRYLTSSGFRRGNFAVSFSTKSSSLLQTSSFHLAKRWRTSRFASARTFRDNMTAESILANL